MANEAVIRSWKSVVAQRQLGVEIINDTLDDSRDGINLLIKQTLNFDNSQNLSNDEKPLQNFEAKKNDSEPLNFKKALGKLIKPEGEKVSEVAVTFKGSKRVEIVVNEEENVDVDDGKQEPESEEVEIRDVKKFKVESHQVISKNLNTMFEEDEPGEEGRDEFDVEMDEANRRKRGFDDNLGEMDFKEFSKYSERFEHDLEDFQCSNLSYKKQRVVAEKKSGAVKDDVGKEDSFQGYNLNYNKPVFVPKVENWASDTDFSNSVSASISQVRHNAEKEKVFAAPQSFIGKIQKISEDDCSSGMLPAVIESVSCKPEQPKQSPAIKTPLPKGFHEKQVLTEERIFKRQQQLDLGKATQGYKNVVSLRESHAEVAHMLPQTPNKREDNSKREFDVIIRAWRRDLHEFDELDSFEKYTTWREDQEAKKVAEFATRKIRKGYAKRRSDVKTPAFRRFNKSSLSQRND